MTTRIELLAPWRTDRWPIAVRASLSMGAAAAIGWLLLGFPAGMLATLGAFTSLYAPNRPYANRAIVLAAVGIAITIMVGAGMELRPLAWGSAGVVVAATGVITFVVNASRVGPPGAYLIVLAGAAGTSLPPKLPVGEAELLVMVGAAVSWVVHMAGALRQPRGPERRAVLEAAAAIEKALEAKDQGSIKCRRAAAKALHEAWAALTTFQPFAVSRGRRLNSLRAINRQLHTIFAEHVLSSTGSAAIQVVHRVRELADMARSREYHRHAADPLPLGRLELWESLRENFDLRSSATRTAILVVIASALAAAISLLVHLERPYWSIAAAVLVLHQDQSWSGVLRKAIDRIGGTTLGLVLAGAILLMRLASVGVVLSIMALQFISELLVVRRYAIAVVFITANALLIASGGRHAVDVPGLVWGRGLDTLLGCMTAVMVYLALGGRKPDVSMMHEQERVNDAIDLVRSFVQSGEVTSLLARRARRDLQHRLLVLASVEERYLDDRQITKEFNSRLLGDVETLEQQGYAALAACWSLEIGGKGFARHLQE
ncbi:MAG TPA: FUSC family protein [Sphingomicrobium sp.]|nr:FUSC family protein [Sphingomicrobium sp.]